MTLGVSGGPRGYDPGKKIKGRKHHILNDTSGWLRHVFADGGDAGDAPRHALAGRGDWVIEIIKRSDAAKHSLVLLPRRSVVERAFAWPGLAKTDAWRRT